MVDGKEYKVYAEKDANNIPWVKNDGVEFVLECTGFYTSAEKSQAHLNAGAKKVLISAPAKDETTPTVVFGVNHEILKLPTTSCPPVPAPPTRWPPWSSC